jgi:hypothetical protein
MIKSDFNDEFLVLLGSIISRFFERSNEEKNKPKQQRVCALVLSLCSILVKYLLARLEPERVKPH